MSGQEGKKERASERAKRRAMDPFLNRAVLSILEHLDDGSEDPGLLCQSCQQKPARKAYGLTGYEDPWTDGSAVRYVCGPECFEEHFYKTEFHYFNCPDCNRWVRSYNPLYPLEEHYVEEDGEKICLRCHEEDEQFVKG
jgi:hypothetical protein